MPRTSAGKLGNTPMHLSQDSHGIEDVHASGRQPHLFFFLMAAMAVFQERNLRPSGAQ